MTPITQQAVVPTETIDEKVEFHIDDIVEIGNPVIASSEFAYKFTNLVHISDEGVKQAAKYVSPHRHMLRLSSFSHCRNVFEQIQQKFVAESYTPRTWRTHSLHICPPDPYDAADPLNKSVLDWIFLISALNFSFWSEKDGTPECYGVEWQDGWDSTERTVWTGYWSLVAALNRGKRVFYDQSRLI